jgi:hypothetical protein
MPVSQHTVYFGPLCLPLLKEEAFKQQKRTFKGPILLTYAQTSSILPFHLMSHRERTCGCNASLSATESQPFLSSAQLWLSSRGILYFTICTLEYFNFIILMMIPSHFTHVHSGQTHRGWSVQGSFWFIYCLNVSRDNNLQENKMLMFSIEITILLTFLSIQSTQMMCMFVCTYHACACIWECLLKCAWLQDPHAMALEARSWNNLRCCSPPLPHLRESLLFPSVCVLLAGLKASMIFLISSTISFWKHLEYRSLCIVSGFAFLRIKIQAITPVKFEGWRIAQNSVS